MLASQRSTVPILLADCSVAFEMRDLREALATEVAGVGFDLVVRKHVSIQVAQLFEVLATFETEVRLDAFVV